MLSAGCGSTAEESGTQTTEAQEAGPRIGIVFDSFVIERWERDRDIFTSTAQELGADVLVGNANGDPQEQKKVIQHMIDNRVDVLVIIAIDGAELVQSVADAHKDGIKVISYDRIIENADTDLYITFDNYKVGTYMAQAINEALPDGGTYMELCGSPTDHNVDMVQEGFDKAIADNLTMIDSMSCTNWDDTEAFDYFTNHAEDLTEADAFMCGNDAIAGQAVRALAERRLAGQKVVTGQDADLASCQRIAEGTQTMTIYKPIERLAGQAARIPSATERMRSRISQSIPSPSPRTAWTVSSSRAASTTGRMCICMWGMPGAQRVRKPGRVRSSRGREPKTGEQDFLALRFFFVKKVQILSQTFTLLCANCTVIDKKDIFFLCRSDGRMTL